MAKNEMTRTFAPDGSDPITELQEREATIAKNLEVLDKSTMQEAIGRELISIQEKKLYRGVGFKSFKSYLAARRNRISRSRAYQLIRFAENRRECITAGIPAPANERQLRANQTAIGEVTLFERCWTRVFKYLCSKFHNLPLFEQERFVETLGLVVSYFRAQVGKTETGVKHKQNHGPRIHHSERAPT